MSDHLRQGILGAIELVILTALILILRCANHSEVFVGGNVYFTDADCYSRMSQVALCAERPGLIVRHHDFENFPQGTTPHTTAPLDYLILALAWALQPFSTQAFDLAGALISPLLAVCVGCFLWWWMRRENFRYRWPALILFSISPILVHGTELGRPDHQSLLMLLVVMAVCAEWSLSVKSSRGWGVVSGCSWALAFWVSLYEPLILFVIVIASSGVWNRSTLLDRERRVGWLCFLAVMLAALLVERRIPSFPFLNNDPFVRNWAHSIGELRPVPLLHAVWFHWAGYLVLLLPVIIWWNREALFGDCPGRARFVTLMISLGATFLGTLGQARWAYFFVSLFVVALPIVLQAFSSRAAVWTAFLLSLWPVAQDWDARIWPNEEELTRRAERRVEGAGWRELAEAMRGPERHGFLAPWWVSPCLAYWSHQPGLAGSSHEGLSGIVESARFYASGDVQRALKIVANRRIDFVVSYDAGRVAESCGQILGQPTSEHAVCYVLDRAPAMSPAFLVLASQNPTGKLFRVANNR